MENVARRMSTPGFSIDKIEENLDREIKEDLEKEEENGLRKMWVQKDFVAIDCSFYVS